MKNILLTALSMMGICSYAQWNIDPLDPTLVSNEDCKQQNVQQVDDGDGGVFVFWKDGRIAGCNSTVIFDVYGQHYDDAGFPLWEPGGRPILDYQNDIRMFQVLRDPVAEELIIGCIVDAADDSVLFQKLDDNGAKMWAEDLAVGISSSCLAPSYLLGYSDLSFNRNVDTYTVMMSAGYCGGAVGCRVAKFNSNGELLSPLNGDMEGSQYSISDPTMVVAGDASGDFFLSYFITTGDGVCLRIGAAGDTIWTATITEGFTYNSRLRGLSDEDGIAYCFLALGTDGYSDIFLRKLNSDGSVAYTTTVCGAAGPQGSFRWRQDADYYYVCWADARPGIACGASDIYAQKIDKTTGNVVWTTDGIAVFEQCTYMPYPKLVVADDGSVIVCNQSTTVIGINMMRINPDGSFAWPEPVSVSTNSTLPFYDESNMIRSDNASLFAWSAAVASGGADGIYFARVPDVFVMNVIQDVNACDSYTLDGITYDESGTYIQQISPDTIITLNLNITSVEAGVILTGNTFEYTGEGGFTYWLDCANGEIVFSDSDTFTPTETGEYALMVQSDGCSDTSACTLVTIIGVNEISDRNAIRVYPNPGTDKLVINSDIPFNNAVLAIIAADGQLIMQKRISGNNVLIDTTNLPKGIYTLRILDEMFSSSRWIKQ